MHNSHAVFCFNQGNGKPCGETLQYRDCGTDPCPAACKYEWSEYSDCSATCGGGYKKRTVKVASKSLYGGKECPEDEEEACGDYPCPVDCKVSDYSDWGDCDKTCGPGIQLRKREIEASPEYGGEECPYEYQEERNCNYKECQIHCKYEWAEWGYCDVTCGGGHQYRAPNIQVKGQYGGDECPAPEERVCSTEECPVDCIMGEWQGWGDCSEYCGDGVQHNRRIIMQDPAYGGLECSDETDTRSCYDMPCPKHCEYGWGEWSDCTYTCGGGTQKRDPKITQQPQYGGDPCPYQESRSCEQQPCPIHCVVADWYKWSECSQLCGPGLEYRRRGITTHPQYGGKECPKTVEVKHCQTKACEYHDDDQFYQGNVVSHEWGHNDDDLSTKVADRQAKHLQYAARAQAKYGKEGVASSSKVDSMGVSNYGGAALNTKVATGDDDYDNKNTAATALKKMSAQQILSDSHLSAKMRENVRREQIIKRKGHGKKVANYKTNEFHVTRKNYHGPGWVQGTHYGEDYLNPGQQQAETRSAHLNVAADDDYMHHRDSDDDHFEKKVAKKTKAAIDSNVAKGLTPVASHNAGGFATDNSKVSRAKAAGNLKHGDDDDGYGNGYMRTEQKLGHGQNLAGVKSGGVGGAGYGAGGGTGYYGGDVDEDAALKFYTAPSKVSTYGFDFPAIGRADLIGASIDKTHYQPADVSHSTTSYTGEIERQHAGPSADYGTGGRTAGARYTGSMYAGTAADVITRTDASDYEHNNGRQAIFKKPNHYGANHKNEMGYKHYAARADLKAEAYALNNAYPMGPITRGKSANSGGYTTGVMNSYHQHMSQAEAMAAGEADAEIEHNLLRSKLAKMNYRPKTGDPAPFSVPTTTHMRKVHQAPRTVTKDEGEAEGANLEKGLREIGHASQELSSDGALTHSSSASASASSKGSKTSGSFDYHIHHSATGRIIIGLSAGAVLLAGLALVVGLVVSAPFRNWARDYASRKPRTTGVAMSTPGAAAADEAELDEATPSEAVAVL